MLLPVLSQEKLADGRGTRGVPRRLGTPKAPVLHPPSLCSVRPNRHKGRGPDSLLPPAAVVSKLSAWPVEVSPSPRGWPSSWGQGKERTFHRAPRRWASRAAVRQEEHCALCSTPRGAFEGRVLAAGGVASDPHFRRGLVGPSPWTHSGLLKAQEGSAHIRPAPLDAGLPYCSSSLPSGGGRSRPVRWRGPRPPRWVFLRRAQAARTPPSLRRAGVEHLCRCSQET